MEREAPSLNDQATSTDSSINRSPRVVGLLPVVTGAVSLDRNSTMSGNCSRTISSGTPKAWSGVADANGGRCKLVL